MFFKRYRKIKPGDKPWTKNALVTRMYQEINLPDISRSQAGNKWKLRHDLPLYLLFEKLNFDDKHEITLVTSLYFEERDGEWNQIIEDFRGVAIQYYGVKAQGKIMHIWKDEEFEGSHLEKQCREVYRPFILALRDGNRLRKACAGEVFHLNGRSIKLTPLASPIRTD